MKCPNCGSTNLSYSISETISSLYELDKDGFIGNEIDRTIYNTAVICCETCFNSFPSRTSVEEAHLKVDFRKW